MKKLKKLQCFIFICIFIFTTSCDIVFFDDINTYKDNIILEMKQDSAGSIIFYEFYLKDMYGNYNYIIVRPEFGKLFNIGDTI